jgi:CRISPR-associated protein Cmr1
VFTFTTKTRTIEAEFELVTPAFIGNGDQDEAELRPPSIKGALRFWWRALQWGKHYRQCRGNEASALENLHLEENRLFGSAAEDRKSSGQGLFLINLHHGLRSAPKDKIKPPSVGYQYLLGQGLFHHRDLFARGCLAPGRFRLVLTLKSGASTDDIQSLKNALLALGMFGGLGSRARHGSGSIAIQKLTVLGEDYPVPENEESFERITRGLLNDLPDREPPFSAFGPGNRVDISLNGSSAMDLLNKAGDAMLKFRGRATSFL